MKLTLPELLLIFLFFSFSNIAKTQNIVGGEMSYTCLGNGDYEINLDIYKACVVGGNFFDGPLDGAISIYLGDSQVEFARVAMIDVDANGMAQIFSTQYNLPCLPNPLNECLDVGEYTIQQAIRLSDQNIVLPKSDESYHIVYQRCCRNNTITNIENPGSTGITISTEIIPEAQPDDNGNCVNSSPLFFGLPNIVICKDEEYTYQLQIDELDGDQLIFELCSPLAGGGPETNPSDGFNGVNPNPDQYPSFDNVNFLPPFSAANPLSASQPLSVSTNGLLSVVPTEEGQFLFAVCVKEYRNGIFLSETKLEMQFNVISCIPLIDTQIGGDDFISSDSVFRFESCTDTTITFEDLTDYNFIDEYRWEFDNGINTPYISTEQNPTVDFAGKGTYEGILILNPGTLCTDTAYIVVEILPLIFPAFTFSYEPCEVAPIQFFDESTAEADAIVGWSWDFGDGETSMEQNPSHQYDLPGKYIIELEVTDNLGCSSAIIDSIEWFPTPTEIQIDPSETEGCPPLEVSFNNAFTFINSEYDVNWDFGDGTFDTIFNPTHIYTATQNYTPQIEVTSPTGCFLEQTFADLISVAPLPEADFIWTEQITSFKPEFVFENRSIGETNWFWNFSEEGISYLENPTFTFQDTGFQVVILTVESQDGCTDVIQQTIEVVFPILYFLPNAFTPNQDGDNERYLPVGIFSGIKDYQFTIWNRYGELVFETDNPYDGWNGKKNNSGRSAPNGVYICKVNFLDSRGKEYAFNEFVTLVR